jgi:hypothetical protein
MDSSSSSLSAQSSKAHINVAWSQHLTTRPRGLAMARENGFVLAWDEFCLYLLDRRGARQAQRQMPAGIAVACCADDGSAYAVLGRDGTLRWLAPDLSERWRQNLGSAAVAAALDPLGQYVAVADASGDLRILDRHSRSISRTRTPRPLHHVAFLPAAPFIIGCADYGLAACFDCLGRCIWRDGLVAHVGSLAVDSEGDQVVIACFTEGIQRYDGKGKNKGRLHLAEPCRLASISYDGRWILTVNLKNRLALIDQSGRELLEYRLEKSPTAIALSPLGNHAVAALSNGHILGLDVREGE